MHQGTDAKARVLLDMERDAHELREQRWPFTAKRAPPPRHPLGPKAKAYVTMAKAAAQPPARKTKAQQLREEATRRKLEDREEHELRQQAAVEFKQRRSARLADELRDAAGTKDRMRELELLRETKLAHARAVQQMQEEAYQRCVAPCRPCCQPPPLMAPRRRHLVEMQMRVEHRPLLLKQAGTMPGFTKEEAWVQPGELGDLAFAN